MFLHQLFCVFCKRFYVFPQVCPCLSVPPVSSKRAATAAENALWVTVTEIMKILRLSLSVAAAVASAAIVEFYDRLLYELAASAGGAVSVVGESCTRRGGPALG